VVTWTGKVAAEKRKEVKERGPAMLRSEGKRKRKKGWARHSWDKGTTGGVGAGHLEKTSKKGKKDNKGPIWGQKEEQLAHVMITQKKQVKHLREAFAKAERLTEESSRKEKTKRERSFKCGGGEKHQKAGKGESTLGTLDVNKLPKGGGLGRGTRRPNTRKKND